MDWIHCNNCFCLPDKEKSFSLTSCGHIYCKDCEVTCAHGQCKLCGNQCSSITLSSTMKADVQIYFTDPDELLKKKLKEVQQVSDFQKNHRSRLISHQRKNLQKFKTMKDDFRKLIKNLKDLDNEKRKMAKENAMLKKYLCEMLQRGNSSSAHNLDRARSKSYDGTMLNSFKTTPANFQHPQKLSEDSMFQSGRLTVKSPPSNGRLGVIPGTPSPSSILKQLNLGTAGSKGSSTRSFRGGSHYESFYSPGDSQSVVSDPFTPPLNPGQKGAHRDVKKMVVHPYSPDDSPIQ